MRDEVIQRIIKNGKPENRIWPCKHVDENVMLVANSQRLDGDLEI